MKSIDWTRWSAIAQVVSSIAIVVMLIYVTIQTQQNAAAILAASPMMEDLRPTIERALDAAGR